jgi:beta-lactamase class A
MSATPFGAADIGISVRDLATGRVVERSGDSWPLRIASVGKVLLLVTVADQLESGELDPSLSLRRDRVDVVADSGLWQHLAVDELCVADLAVLVGSVSDNLATNVLLRHVGLDAVRETTIELGLASTGLHDRVRDHRGPGDPPTLATGTAAELSGLMAGLARGHAVSPPVSRRVLGWLAAGVDLSLVAAAFGLDPLAHGSGAGPLTLRNKTGADAGVRADVGILTGRAASLAYAAVANFDDTPAALEGVLAAMRDLGARLRLAVGAEGTTRA